MEKNEIRHTSHSTFRCQYHIVFAPKYRRKIIYGQLKKEIGAILRKLCEQKDVQLIEAEACPDHIHIDVLVLRKRLPNAPRSFRSPGGILLPVIGIIGTVYMLMNISTDPVERMQIWVLTGAVFLILAVYSCIWIKTKMRMPVFKPVPLEKVMAMESDMYYAVRKRRGIWK